MPLLRSADNFVRDMVFGNCQRPFYIYVLTFIPSFIGAAFMLRFFDFNDIVRASGEVLTREGSPGRRRKKHGTIKKGKALPKGTPHRGYQMALRHLLFITQPLEKIGFGLLFWGAIDLFYTNWMMWLDDADACIDKGFFEAEMRSDDDTIAGPNEGGGFIIIENLISDNQQIQSTNIGASVPLGRLIAMLAITMIGPGPGPQTYKLRIRAGGTLGKFTYDSEEIAVGEDASQDFIVQADLLYPLVTGGTLVWELVGPPVPSGITVTKADVVLQRKQHVFG